LSLGYTFQQSRQWVFNLRQSAGTYSYNSGGVATAISSDPGAAVTPAVSIFDTRTYYLTSSGDVSWLPSPRTSYTFGGSGTKIDYRANALAAMNGYTFNGGMNHIATRNTSVGVAYVRTHYGYPNFYGTTDINTFEGTFGAVFGRVWTFTLRGGAFIAETHSLQAVTLPPALAALFRTQVVFQKLYIKTTDASGLAELKRQFKRSSLSLQYSRSVTPGNGIYLASLVDNGTVRFSYTALRKLNMAIDGTYYGMTSLGADLQKDTQLSAGAGLSYELIHAVHLTARYDARHQELDLGGYKQHGYRVSFGLAFSPGNIPLSLW